ncbi:MAG: efflux RND transporter permease subunit [Vicinamibacterales bacterium]
MSVPQIDADVDRERVKSYGVALTDVFETLQLYLGSLYVNGFRPSAGPAGERQAESGFRLQLPDPSPADPKRPRSDGAARVARDRDAQLRAGPGDALQRLSRRRDQRRSGAQLQLGPGAGGHRGRAARAAAVGHDVRWTELAYQELLAGNTMLYVFPLCVLLVYMVLAALYESWTLPLSVILIVPMVLFSAIAGVWLTGGDNNVFTQISFLVLAGLACKNAILIVEFAKEKEHEGMSHVEAVLEACRIRLRPILMTSLAFNMGVVPLVFSTGAGFEIRQAMGIAVFAGMLGVTLFGLFFTPVFYTLIGRLTDRLSRTVRQPRIDATVPVEGHS